MAIVGYARVSTIDQDFESQIALLEQAGCTKIFSEKLSGTKRKGREQLEACIDYLREGDIFLVTRIDRLARSIRDLQNLVHQLHDKGVVLQATEQSFDISTSAGKAFFDMLGVFAEFENNIRRERQLEGIAAAKAKGKYKGGKPTAMIKAPQVMALLQQGINRKEIAQQVAISIASVYRIIRENKIKNHDRVSSAR